MHKQLSNSHKKTILAITKGILSAAKDKPKGIPEGTLLMCFASFGLSTKQYKDFSAMLLRSNLLAFNDNSSNFMITEKGLNWIERV